MQTRKGLFVEAGVVGASLALIGGGLDVLCRRSGLEDEAAAQARRVPLPVFLFAAGALAHLAWEAVGGNRWFSANFPATLDEPQRDAFMAMRAQKIAKELASNGE
jgi:hypothetical protein